MIDTSQHGDFNNFRNVTLDAQDFRISLQRTQLPARGILEFDYVSTDVSHLIARSASMPTSVFRNLCLELQLAWKSFKIVEQHQRQQKTTDSQQSQAPRKTAEAAICIQTAWRRAKLHHQFIRKASDIAVSAIRSQRGKQLSSCAMTAVAGTAAGFEHRVTQLQAAFRGRRVRHRLAKLRRHASRPGAKLSLDKQLAAMLVEHDQSFGSDSWRLPPEQIDESGNVLRLQVLTKIEYNRKIFNRQLAMLRRTSEEHCFTVAQLERLLTIICQNSNTQEGMKWKYASDVVVVLFSRLVDPENLMKILRLVNTNAPDEYSTVTHRIGQLNLFNPFDCDMHIAIKDLSVSEGRRLVMYMSQISAREGGKHWVGAKFHDQGFEVGREWERLDSIPTRGSFEADFATPEAALDLRVRCPLARCGLMPGAGRWLCSKLLLLNPAGLEEVYDVDGVHPSTATTEIKCKQLALDSASWAVVADGTLVSLRSDGTAQTREKIITAAIATVKGRQSKKNESTSTRR